MSICPGALEQSMSSSVVHFLARVMVGNYNPNCPDFQNSASDFLRLIPLLGLIKLLINLNDLKLQGQTPQVVSARKKPEFIRLIEILQLSTS